jgi:hypothetical protein
MIALAERIVMVHVSARHAKNLTDAHLPRIQVKLLEVPGTAPRTHQPTCSVGVWDSVVDSTFVLDMFFNFRTAYMVDDPVAFLMTSRLAIAKRYLQGFFLLDMASTIPWDILLTNERLGFVQLFKLSKFLRVVRVARALKLMRILKLLKVPTTDACYHAEWCSLLLC